MQLTMQILLINVDSCRRIHTSLPYLVHKIELKSNHNGVIVAPFKIPHEATTPKQVLPVLRLRYQPLINTLNSHLVPFFTLSRH